MARVSCAKEQDRVQASRPRSQQRHMEQVPDGCQGEPGIPWGRETSCRVFNAVILADYKTLFPWVELHQTRASLVHHQRV